MKRNNKKTIAVVLSVLVIAAVAPPKLPTRSRHRRLERHAQHRRHGPRDRAQLTLDEAKKIQGTFDSITQGAFGLKLGTSRSKTRPSPS